MEDCRNSNARSSPINAQFMMHVYLRVYLRLLHDGAADTLTTLSSKATSTSDFAAFPSLPASVPRCTATRCKMSCSTGPSKSSSTFPPTLKPLTSVTKVYFDSEETSCSEMSGCMNHP